MLLTEVFAYLGIFFAYVWFALPMAGPVRWYHAAFVLFAVGFPVGMNLLHGDRPRDSGLRVDNLAAAAREVGAAALVMGLGVAAVGLAVGGFHRGAGHADKYALYLLWGPFQQYVLQAFVVRRFRQAGLGGWTAVSLAAILFGLCHAPNWVLMVLTTAAGVVWGRLFLRRPNLIPIGLSHGLLAILLYHAWPEDWTQHLTIGGEYLRRMGAGGAG